MIYRVVSSSWGLKLEEAEPELLRNPECDSATRDNQYLPILNRMITILTTEYNVCLSCTDVNNMVIIMSRDF
ncbi:hypothetical protein KUTeg_017882 [Tegillarca granosa]|uniref:Uncharacterized protein n=1 Tax=Tegillarca granosa TaxID=220873 RepID=A0ABQ9EG71_TEGGR|nr:hypothetical protein KUTeg_017882 [Tegillarca granosa]